ncbi:baseplate J/gp47 family protein [Acetobacter fallax]|uniref:Baseplate protein J-like domain-containing protein n=1 Tax=Acetobacter fallax TaxID=1737473 RepID=A0ABX0KA90_9PROT|nr:baseplate J/gp47 family protein [Acetobacter fallax]NHO33337.1 hypothetical protein [Acetobacter fallax]NHO36958.1 hypothetical protein [Acetobacter fallax]
MTLEIPTPSTIARRFAAALLANPVTASDGSQVVLDANAPGSVEQVLGGAFSMEMTGVYRYARDWCLELMVTTATPNGLLPQHAVQWGVPRIAAQSAIGNVLVAGTLPTVVPIGQAVTIDGSVNWTVTAETTLVAGTTVSMPVMAATSGSVGNLAAGTALTAVTPIAGVTSVVVDGSGLAGGAAIEAADSWRARIIDEIRNPPGGGTPDDYVKWAKAAGAAYVNVVGGWLGVGTVGVIVAMAGRVAPTAAQISAIQAYIDDPSRKIVRANATVIPATIVSKTIVLSIDPDTLTARAAVEQAVSSFYGGTGLGAELYLSQLSDAISSVAGETSHLIISPTDNEQLAPNQLTVLGGVAWQAAS